MMQGLPATRKFVTPSDKAFAMVVYKNNFERWYEEEFEVDPRVREKQAKWTESKNARKSGHSNKILWLGTRRLRTNEQELHDEC